MMRRAVLIMVMALATVAAGVSCRGPQAVPQTEQAPEQLDALVDRCMPMYVFIGGGSGAIISADGYMITNYHVVKNVKRWRVRTADGAYHTATVVGTAESTDLALLKLDGKSNLKFLPLGDSDSLKLGEAVVAIGDPFGLGLIDGHPSVTLGVVSALHLDRDHAYDAIQTDASINPGNSGGPLVNLRGELMGVNCQIEPRFGVPVNTGVGYSISANQVKRFLPALKAAKGGDVAPARISGVIVRDGSDNTVLIEDIIRDSDADRAGLRRGDVIERIGSDQPDCAEKFFELLSRYPQGAPISVTARRGIDRVRATIIAAGAREAWIGIGVGEKVSNGVVVSRVTAGGPADKAGMKKGDILLRIGMVPIHSSEELRAVLSHLQPGLSVPVTVLRGERTTSLSVVIGELKQAKTGDQ